MKNLIYLTLAIITFTLTACATSAEWVRRDYSPEKRGVLRYKNLPYAEGEKGLQADAGDKMANFCGGQNHVKIKTEALGQQLTGSTTKYAPETNSSTTVVNSDDYTYVHFECM